MTRQVAFWAGWAIGGFATWMLVPEADAMCWIPAGVYAVIDYFRTDPRR